uniref:Protein TIC 214 n=1 Tax=Euonymus hamiltonianus TaxID=408194 RepID=A0A2R4QIG8_9ROSI|nr:Ycf1 [Euonymus hamiltonianus]AVY52423.1 Ycf1 [Euonymus hamiltonianus]
MIFKSFILGNLVSLSLKIINSVVVVGLYYGFLTTFSIGPSYLFLLRARVMEEGEEGTEKKVSATTGFITGQLMMFISIYYAPLYLAFGRPHTITVLALPYLLFHFFWNNHKHFFDYGSTTTNSMRNLSIQCVFLNNLIFQLFNHFILPSSMLVRLVNIYMFRCNNKMLFVTSSFVGWLIGHILFMKWVGFVLVWIQQKNSIRSNVLIRSNKYLVSELRNSMARILSILLFITCVYYLGRIPSPLFIKKLKETSEREERGESEEETDVEIEKTSETKGTKQEQEESPEEEPSSYLLSEEKDKIDETKEKKVNVNGKSNDESDFPLKETSSKKKKVYVYDSFYLDENQENPTFEIFKDTNIFWFEKTLVTRLFDYKRWNRPFRYIKNDGRERAVRNEMSQFFFYTCLSDGKEKMPFTYLPSLSVFFDLIERKIPIFTTEKTEKMTSPKLYNRWGYMNDQKTNKLNNEFLSRVETLDFHFLAFTLLDKRTRLCKNTNEYLPKIYDPLLNGPSRRKIKKLFLFPLRNEKKYINPPWITINRIHDILFTTNFDQKQRIDTFERKAFSNHEHRREDRRKIGINEISKKVPRWSYKLINELEQQEREHEEISVKDYEIRSRKSKRVIIFTENRDTYNNTKNTTNPETNHGDNNPNAKPVEREIALIRYSQQPDFRRDIIKGSMRPQRRKTITWELFQPNIHSPLFLDRLDKPFLFSFDISQMMKIMFINLICKNREFVISDYSEDRIQKSDKKEKDKREEKARVEIAEAWDNILFAHVIRGSLLVIQSILRKYIFLPLLIIAKNTIRTLLFQFPEWSEDLKDWNKEMHVKCTYNGVQLSEKDFPKNWLTEGIQIKILFPFRLKPWHRVKLQCPQKDPMKGKKSKKKNFCFLTVFGMEAEFPFGSTKRRTSLFDFKPICKKLEERVRKFTKKSFLFIRILKKRTKFSLNFTKSKESKKRVIKKSPLFLVFLKKKLKELITILLVFSGLDELNETKKDFITNKKTIHESAIQIIPMDWTNSSLAEARMQDLTNKKRTIINQIKKKKEPKVILKKNKSANKITYGTKRFGSLKKTLKRRNARVVRKFHFLKKKYIEQIYIDIFLSIIKILRMNAELFLESARNLIDKYIYNNDENQEKDDIDKVNKNTINFILNIKKSLTNISNKKERLFRGLSSLSQAYVFYKLSQTKFFNLYNLYKLRSSRQYHDHDHGTNIFLKNKIKDYFGVQGIFHSQLRHKKPITSTMNQWKNWLKAGHYHYQYYLSQIRWSRLGPQKWRTIVNQGCIAENKYLKKKKNNSYEKDQLIQYEKKNNFEAEPLLNKKNNFKKHYRYDLLAYKFINDEDPKDSDIFRFLLKEKNNQGIFLYNYKTYNHKCVHLPGDVPMNNYLGEDEIMDIEKNPARKYFDWRILRFCIRNKMDIEFWIDTGTKSNKNTKTVSNNSQIIDKINKKSLFYLIFHQDEEINSSLKKKKKLFDWMEMNERLLSHSILNLELWFFPEILILYNAYKKTPVAIPIKLLLFDLNENVFEKKKVNNKKKRDTNIFLFSNEKKTIEVKNQNEEEKESERQVDLGSVRLNQEKGLEESFAGSDTQKKKKYKSSTEAELDFLLKRYFCFQLRWNASVNQRVLNNIKVFCLLLRLINPNEIAISSIQRREMSLDILLIQNNLSLTEFLKKGILIIEPVRLAVKNVGQFLMYQTINISLGHKSKHKMNPRHQEKGCGDKTNFDESIAKHKRNTGNKNQNLDDFFVPENTFLSQRRREFGILISLNSKNSQGIHQINTEFFNGKKTQTCGNISTKNKDLYRDREKKKKKLIKFKRFFWTNYRLEDLACMNRCWFDTNNGSRFNMVRIHMYPRLKTP